MVRRPRSRSYPDESCGSATARSARRRTPCVRGYDVSGRKGSYAAFPCALPAATYVPRHRRGLKVRVPLVSRSADVDRCTRSLRVCSAEIVSISFFLFIFLFFQSFLPFLFEYYYYYYSVRPPFVLPLVSYIYIYIYSVGALYNIYTHIYI